MAALLSSNDAFEAYFKRADLDQDGRISGSEAVAFFQGSNLPQPVLAQIWKYSDQNNNGFLGRPEFFNALRLATVAQSGRQLTPDIVKAALFGPAASKIPAPQIKPSHAPATSMSSPSIPRPQMGTSLPSSTHIGVSTATGSQNAGPRAVLPTLNQQTISTISGHFARPPHATPAGATGLFTRPQISSSSSISADWFGMNSGVTVGSTTQGLTQSIVPSSIQAAVTSSSAIIMDSKDPKALTVSGNGFSSSSTFGGDAFSAPSVAKQDGISVSFSSGSKLGSLGNTSTTAAFQSSRIGEFDSSNRNVARPLGHNQYSLEQSMLQKSPLDSIKATSATDATKLSADLSNSANKLQTAWPKISQTDIQKYTKVFVEVDKDRDGKITGEQARNLFLSWRLPREVLKQVWDLSDQDNDSMLSFREFCIALYLMERHREGHPLPALLPDMLRFDETLVRVAGLPPSSYGLSRQLVPGSHPHSPVTSITGIRPPLQTAAHFQGDGASYPSQQRLMTPFPGSMVNQQNEQQVFEGATDGQKKSKEVENKILDSRETIEYYRLKMQELVLYKSRCDNKLNEISERASSDKREAESLEKKYEEKYKQVAEVASKLTVEEATFRDIQGRKSELQNAIAIMEKGGSSDGLLQVRADRIQSDLEELVKALHERCKHQGLGIKSKAIIELPFGWQPGISEGAIDWDEDWDKFDDEGFSVAKGFSVVVQNNASSSPKVSPAWIDENSNDRESPAAPIGHPFSLSERISSDGGQFPESESVYDQGEYESVRSPPGRNVFETSSQDNSPRVKDDHSHGDAESMFSGDKLVDEPNWGAVFDTNDDEVDSIWGFSTKDDGREKTTENSFFASEDFGTNHINVDSPHAIKKSPFFDSVPSTPQFKSNSSPRFSEESEDHTFNNFSRFDSFSTHDNMFSPKHGGHARFDSVSSVNDFDRSRGFSLFDDSDPFAAGPFRPPESRSPSKNADNWNSF